MNATTSIPDSSDNDRPSIIPDGGTWTTLGDVLRLRKDIVHPRDKPEGMATFVGLEHVESGNGRRLGSLEIDMARMTGRKPRFYKDDIVYGYLRPYLNKVWVANFDGLCSVDQYVYSVASDLADRDFVAWFMRSPTYLERAPITTAPGQLPRIRIEEVASVPFYLPPLDEQRRIASRLSEHMKNVDRMRELTNHQLDAINRLPDAILGQAFAGGI